MNAAELGGSSVGDRSFVYISKGVLPEVAREVRKLGHQRRERRPGRRAGVPERLARRERHRVRELQRHGLAGLELALDKRLTGTAGKDTYERGRMGQAIPGGYSKETPGAAGRLGHAHAAVGRPVPGAGGARRAGRRHRRGLGLADRADAKTGEIYALADSNTVDPNHPGDWRAARCPARSRTCSSRARPARSSRCRRSSTTTSRPRCRSGQVPYAVLARRQGDVPRLARARPAAPDHHRCPRGVLEHGHRHDRPEPAGADAVRLPGEVRLRRQDRHRDAGGVAGILHPVDTWQRRDKFAVLFGQSRVGDRDPGHTGVRDDRQRRRAGAAAHHQGLDVPGRHVHAVRAHHDAGGLAR